MANPHDMRPSGPPNSVMGITEARVFAVAFTNAEGRQAMCLALQFGIDTSDRKPGVYIMAEEAQMREMRIAGTLVRDAVRKAVARGAVETEVVPDDVMPRTETGGFNIADLTGSKG